MFTISTEDLLHRLQWRYAVKSFDPAKKIPAPAWDTLETALQLTPSSYGLQPWKFIVVESPAIREQLRAASWNQKQITDSSHLVVLTHHPEVREADVDRFLDTMAEARKISRESLHGYRNVILGDVMGHRKPMISEWTARQCYIALGNFMTAAALLGIDTCPMEGLDPKKYDEILGLNETRFRTVVACAAGYRAPGDKYAGEAKIRFPKNEILERR